MTKTYTIRIAWERFNVKKALLAVFFVLGCCFAAVFFTARPAIAEKRQTGELYKYYTAITVQQGDTLWSIAERQLSSKENSSEYKGTRSYMKEVVLLNKLDNGNYLLAGQKLIIPYYSSEYKN